MRTLAATLAVLVLLSAGSGVAAADLASISGTLTPTTWVGTWDSPGFDIIADTANIVDAQSQSVVVKGVTLYTEYDGDNFEVGLLQEQSDADAIYVYPVANDGAINFIVYADTFRCNRGFGRDDC